MQFTWDPAKELENWRKHRVRFTLAAKVFYDPLVQLREDRVVDGEQRWHALGIVEGDLLLLVVHTVHGEWEDIVRIISARKAEAHEREEYEDGHDK